MTLRDFLRRRRPPLGHRVATRLRRILTRHPAGWWLIVAAITAAFTWSVHQRLAAVDLERDSWGDMVTVYVADRSMQPGEPIAATAVSVPLAIRPPTAYEYDEPPSGVARRPIDAGEIITTTDLGGAGPLAMVPLDWRVVAVVESPGSGAQVGERVDVIADGIVLHAGALVVGRHEGATLTAVPADIAPIVALAADHSGISLVRVP